MEVGCCDRREGEGCVRAGGGQGRRAISRLACRQQAPKAVNLIVGGTATLAATAMYLAKYLTKNDALALTEEDGDDGLPPLLDDSDDDLLPSCSYLIIDEMSMVGRRSLGQIDHLLQQATGHRQVWANA